MRRRRSNTEIVRTHAPKAQPGGNPGAPANAGRRPRLSETSRAGITRIGCEGSLSASVRHAPHTGEAPLFRQRRLDHKTRAARKPRRNGTPALAQCPGPATFASQARAVRQWAPRYGSAGARFCLCFCLRICLIKSHLSGCRQNRCEYCCTSSLQSGRRAGRGEWPKRPKRPSTTSGRT